MSIQYAENENLEKSVFRSGFRAPTIKVLNLKLEALSKP